jgi:hypothetical protein
LSLSSTSTLLKTATTKACAAASYAEAASCANANLLSRLWSVSSDEIKNTAAIRHPISREQERLASMDWKEGKEKEVLKGRK